MFHEAFETFGILFEVSIGMSEQVLAVAFLTFLILMAVLIVAIALSFRYKKRELQHRERLVALEKGIEFPVNDSPGHSSAPWTPRVFLLRGMMWLFAGIGLGVFLFGVSLASPHEEPAWVRVDQATHARENGATPDQIRQIMSDREERGGLPAGVALIGLVPIGIGLAYLVAYRGERSAAQL